MRTPLEEISSYNKGGQTTYSQGVTVSGGNMTGIAAAVEVAAAADRVILMLGIDQSVEGESHDRTSIDLPSMQHKLAEMVLGLKKPTVIVLINGGMVAVEQEKKSAPAILEAFYPGFFGAKAIAATVFGANEHLGGKMPYTIYPKDYVSQVKMSDMEMTAGPGRSYKYYTDEPTWCVLGTNQRQQKNPPPWRSPDVPDIILLDIILPSPHRARTTRRPFGYGISLTSFSIKNATQQVVRTVSSAPASPATMPVYEYSATVTNTGKVTGDEVLFAYMTPKAATGAEKDGTLPLIKKLVDYTRVHLAPGQSQTVT